MSETSDAERVERAVAFMVAEYGEAAVAEAERGLEYSRQVNNAEAVEAFTAILAALKSGS